MGIQVFAPATGSMIVMAMFRQQPHRLVTSHNCFLRFFNSSPIEDAIRNIHTREEAQDGFEYLLVVGGVSVGVVVAMLFVPGLIGPLVTKVSAAIATVLP